MFTNTIMLQFFSDNFFEAIYYGWQYSHVCEFRGTVCVIFTMSLPNIIRFGIAKDREYGLIAYIVVPDANRIRYVRTLSIVGDAIISRSRVFTMYDMDNGGFVLFVFFFFWEGWRERTKSFYKILLSWYIVVKQCIV